MGLLVGFIKYLKAIKLTIISFMQLLQKCPEDLIMVIVMIIIFIRFNLRFQTY